MKIINTNIDGVYIIEPTVFKDSRGYFFESWNEQALKEAGIDVHWVQDNESKSSYGVLRGLHYQAAPYTQAKLVRVINGAVLDVAVDIRKDSLTYGKYVAVELTGENKRQLFIPRGFAHGFVVLSDEVTFAYKCDNIWNKESERGIKWDDKDIGIKWGVDEQYIKLSDKDKLHPCFKSIQPWTDKY